MRVPAASRYTCSDQMTAHVTPDILADPFPHSCSSALHATGLHLLWVPIRSIHATGLVPCRIKSSLLLYSSVQPLAQYMIHSGLWFRALTPEWHL